jgi:hypothetical protein
MSKNLQNAKEAWKMGQVISAMNDEEAYYGSGWLYLWPDECSYEECLDTFSDDDSYFEELKDAYYKIFKRHHKDGLYNPERKGPDTIDFANETLKKLNIEGEFKETATNLWTVVTESLKEYAKEEMTEAKAKEPKHLKELIAKLNASQTFELEDGKTEVMESSFNFQLVDRDGQWNLFDANEVYHINYEEDMYYMMKDLASEFAADKQEEESVFEDKIVSQLEEAVKKDFGSDSYIEWQDNVTMIIVQNKKESGHKDTMEKKLTEETGKIELTSEMMQALYKANVDFTEAEDDNGGTFLIVYDWNTIQELQKVIKPDFEPKDEYDTSIIDNLKDVEWGFADEWGKCDESGKLIRTAPDSYSFVPDFWVNDGELLSGDSVRDNHAEEYAQSIINNEKLANTILTDDNLEDIGFIKIEEGFENGWYEKHDSPKQILDTALAKHPNGEFLFSISGQSQFATRFELWAREESLEQEEVEESLTEKITSDVVELFKKAYEGSFFTIVGVGGDIQEWKDGLNEMFAKEEIGQVKEFFTFKGSEMNEWAHLTGDNAYDEDNTFLMFSLDGLKTSKLAMFKLKFGARWFDDIVNNNADREDFHPIEGVKQEKEGEEDEE